MRSVRTEGLTAIGEADQSLSEELRHYGQHRQETCYRKRPVYQNKSMKPINVFLKLR